MQGDVAVVLVDDLFAQGQSDARTVRLGGVERDEDALLCFHGDALSVVLHADLHFVFGRVPAQVDFYFAFGAWGCVACVGNQVNQDLFDLGAVGLERETGIRLVEGEMYALEQLLQVVEKLVHTDGCVLRRGHTGQFAVVLREVEQAFAAAVDGL